MSNNKIRVRSTYYPKETLEINEWSEVYRIGTRCPKYTKEEMGVHINDLYDFSKLVTKTDDFSFSGIKKMFKLEDLW